jgi:hypothetical protein
MYSALRYEFDREYDFYVGEGPVPVPGLVEVSRAVTVDGRRVTLWVRGDRERIRAWTTRRFPPRFGSTPFDFAMAYRPADAP